MNGTQASSNGIHHGVLHLDAVIIGSGFSGIYLLHKLRDELGLNVKIFEAESDIGGTWNNNRYPGARVDCPIPLYAYSLSKIWQSWNWTELYPNQKEIKSYFDHVDRVLDVRKDCLFKSRVNEATFDEAAGQWTVRTTDGKVAMAKYLLVAVGFASKSYLPDWKGLESFQGTIYHSAHWPEAEGVSVKGKKVAVIGTGSTGIQIFQEWAREAEEAFLFQRTPNLCLPMRQQELHVNCQVKDKGNYADYLAECALTFAGLEYQPTPKNTFDASEEEREAFWENLYQLGGFRFWQNNYQDFLTSLDANREAYNFWARKTRARIQDPKKRDLLAPLEPPYPFGTKRPSLEQDFYEQFNKSHVHIVDTKSQPIVNVAPTGIVTADGKVHDVDIIAVATGFDAVTGGLLRLGLKDVNGIGLDERWKDGMSTYLGMAISGFPNMFLPYSLQAPTAFANGPTLIELQGDWITSLISRMEMENLRSLTATPNAESTWNDEVNMITNMTLLPLTDSWYMGSNIPGKPVQSLNYLGGLPAYRERCAKVLDEDFFGFAKA
ncbi:hypothetical protein BDV38DRAFT_292051 [Aspergillus pseudotamarii]|uniref:FAD/NAD(P)-binding domain-containing protein n=1 Tax=Aspergillus pseudotamarii TaxID=132259 RepID=A0A5N6TBA6_ASPPS|nr:uncharacterized protein BDV38DRAFT_292051 [Aspergillus pseudotamarii]KAE8143459.1 hypothetical protein BDV38DRAFT_292051 [Aspergillus pseudotamarii]